MPPVTASPRAGVRTTADRSAAVSGSVPGTTARGSVRTSRRSFAATAPSRRLLRRRFTHHECRLPVLFSTPEAARFSHPTQFLCGVCHARACPAVLCDLSDLERLGVDGPSVCSGAYAGISLCSKDLRNGVCLQHTFPSRADPICMLMAYKEMDLGKTVASPRL